MDTPSCGHHPSGQAFSEYTQAEPLADPHAGQRSLREIAAQLAVKGYINAKGRAFSPLSHQGHNRCLTRVGLSNQKVSAWM
jgi:hypothetical protein